MATFDRDKTNLEHATNPQPGDYWHEMFNPFCVILAVNGNNVTYCDTTKDVGDGWSWDLRFTTTQSIDLFRARISYTSSSEFWVSVRPEAHTGAVKQWKESLGVPPEWITERLTHGLPPLSLDEQRRWYESVYGPHEWPAKRCKQCDGTGELYGWFCGEMRSYGCGDCGGSGSVA